MMPSKSHGQLHDVAIHQTSVGFSYISSFYLSAFANSLALFINEDLEQKEQMEAQWKPKLPLAMVMPVGSLFFLSADSTGARTACL